jgi:hypothetical protein
MSKYQFRLAFITLLQESVLIQGVTTLTLVGTLAYMYINEMSVPQDLINVLLLVLGFYFGGKTQHNHNKRRNKSENSASNNSG